MSKLIQLVIIFSTMLITACEPIRHNMYGSLQNAQGLSEGNVALTVIEDFSSNAPEIMARLPNGEQFRGKVVYEVTVTSGHIDYDNKNNSNQSSTRREDYKTYSPNAQAMLMGNQGHTMNCTFRLANPPIGVRGGGIGQCTISDGRIVPVQF